VILDLNGTRMDPLGTIAAMKADAALAGIPTVGFALTSTPISSTPHGAGADDVLPAQRLSSSLPTSSSRRAAEKHFSHDCVYRLATTTARRWRRAPGARRAT
jgi:hypothetical protein